MVLAQFFNNYRNQKMKQVQLNYKIFSKIDVIKIQIDRAIVLLIDEKDIISAIALAIVAKDILKTVVKFEKEVDINLFKETNENTNFFTNKLEHHNNSKFDTIPISENDAKTPISVICKSFKSISGYYSLQMERFNYFMEK